MIRVVILVTLASVPVGIAVFLAVWDIREWRLIGRKEGPRGFDVEAKAAGEKTAWK